MDEKTVDFGICMAFLMEGLVDYEVSRRPYRGHDPFPEFGRDGIARQIFVPVAEILAEIMNEAGKIDAWERVIGGVFLYEVVSSAGWMIYAQGLSNLGEIKLIIADLFNDFFSAEDSVLLTEKLNELVAIATNSKEGLMTGEDIVNLLERDHE